MRNSVHAAMRTFRKKVAPCKEQRANHKMGAHSRASHRVARLVKPSGRAGECGAVATVSEENPATVPGTAGSLAGRARCPGGVEGDLVDE